MGADHIGPEPDAAQRVGLKNCPHCQAEFDWNELWHFLFLSPGNTMRCLSCTKDSYLTSNRTVLYWGVFLLGLGVAVVVLTVFTTIVPMITMTDTHFTLSLGMILLGAIAGIWTWRFILKVLNLKNGRFSTDAMKQSILDFGR